MSSMGDQNILDEINERSNLFDLPPIHIKIFTIWSCEVLETLGEELPTLRSSMKSV
jgi:hypothetical protein